MSGDRSTTRPSQRPAQQIAADLREQLQADAYLLSRKFWADSMLAAFDIVRMAHRHDLEGLESCAVRLMMAVTRHRNHLAKRVGDQALVTALGRTTQVAEKP